MCTVSYSLLECVLHSVLIVVHTARPAVSAIFQIM